MTFTLCQLEIWCKSFSIARLPEDRTIRDVAKQKFNSNSKFVYLKKTKEKISKLQKVESEIVEVSTIYSEREAEGFGLMAYQPF